MKKSEFKKLFKQLLSDSREGYFGFDELFEEIWYHYNNEVMRNKDLWKEVQRLRKKHETKT